MVQFVMCLHSMCHCSSVVPMTFDFLTFFLVLFGYLRLQSRLEHVGAKSIVIQAELDQKERITRYMPNVVKQIIYKNNNFVHCAMLCLLEISKLLRNCLIKQINDC